MQTILSKKSVSTKEKKEFNMSNPAQLLSLSAPKAFLNKPVSSLHTFYLSGNIEEPNEYINWFEVMRNASETDIIQIHINSYGGDLFTAIQFLRAIADTSAHVICSVEGACMSAATMIFLAADSFEVSEHSSFMFHNYSGGTIGKGGEMVDQLIHERKWSQHLLNRIYADFLAADEIESLLSNKDIWMDGEEVLKRLTSRSEKFQKAEKAAMAEEKKVDRKPVARKPAARKTPIKK
jgi:ATP-dependent Clp protease, protease subunit